MTAMDALAQKLAPHVSDLVADQKRGNTLAARVINLYRLATEDHTAIELCELTFADWLRGKPK